MLNKQDYINAIYQDIEIVRGDTLAFNFDITLEEYDAEKDVAIYSVVVEPAKTKTMDLARYYYDLELSTDDDVITLMRGRLTLVYGVTN